MLYQRFETCINFIDLSLGCFYKRYTAFAQLSWSLIWNASWVQLVLLGSKGHLLGLELATGASDPSGFAYRLSLFATS